MPKLGVVATTLYFPLFFSFNFPGCPLSACSIVRSYFAFAAKWHQNAVVACRLPVVAVAVSSVWLVLNNLPHASKLELWSCGSMDLALLGVYLIFHMPPQLLRQLTAAAAAAICSQAPNNCSVNLAGKRVGAAVSAGLKCFINT